MTSPPDVPVPAIINFSGAVVLVTGGTRGIGLGIAEEFARTGATVVACGRNVPDTSALAGTALTPGNFRFLAADVRDPDQVGALIEQIITEYGRLDHVVNNAGGSPEVLAADASPRFHEAIIKLNLLAPLHVAQAANQVMQTNELGGSIINIASVSATRPSPGTAAYGAAKAGLVNLTQSLAVEWAPKVRVNAVVAGLIATEQAHDHYGGPEGIERVAQTVPMQRMGTPVDIAHTCLYLASSLASYVSGACVTVHGGGERPAFLDAAGATPSGNA